MRQLHKLYLENAWFFRGYLLFLLIGGGLLAQMETGDMVLWFSARRSEPANLLFTFATQLGEPIAFIGVLFLLSGIALRPALYLPVLGFCVTVVAFLAKKAFRHSRPLAYFEDAGLAAQLVLVPGVEVHSGATSFPSGHTMAGFALFAFLAFALPYKKWAGLACLALAAAVGLSRVYLAQHFFKDVYFGSFLGVALSASCYLLMQRPKKQWLDLNLWQALRSLRKGELPGAS